MSMPDSINPFPGLRAFNQEEDYLFFGREEQTMELLQRLSGNRFVAVVGTSGSGKSSLVRCGLLSELLGGKMLQAGAAWEIAVTHPGGNPMALLTEALLEADLYDAEEEHVRENLLATLSRSNFGLVEAVKQADVGDDTNFLLVVDQFEELFRFHEAGQLQQEAANEFVSLLLEATAQTAVPIYVVLTMRSDFIGECGQFEGLAESVNRGEFLIPRLTREQYKRVIEGPTRVAGGKIAPRLLQRLLNDLGQQDDQLPCLQHALMRTWELWRQSGESEALDLEDYQRVGKMAHALSLHADEVYMSLVNDRHRELCRGIFQALTVEESEGRGIRRPQRLSGLCQILEVDAEELLPIIDAFRQPGVTFLLPTADVELSDQTIVDISHESLMRVWTRLRQWVEEEAQAAGIYRRLSESATLHETGEAGLYRNPELGIALAWRDQKRPNQAWAERYQPEFDNAMAFLESSRQAEQAEEQRREFARQKELQQAQKLAEAQSQRAAEQARSAVRLRWLVRGLGLVAMVAITAMIMAWSASHEARSNAMLAAQRASDADKARQATQTALGEVEVARTKAEQNLVQARTAEAEAVAAEKRSREFRYATDMQLAARMVNDTGVSATQVVARLEEHDPASNDELTAADDLRGFEWHYLKNLVDSRATIYAAFERSPIASVLTADGELVTLTSEGLLQRWDSTTQQQKTAALDLKNGRPIGLLALSPDGNRVAMATGNQVRLFDSLTGEETVRPLPTPSRSGLVFSPDSRMVITTDVSLGWWEVATGKPIALQHANVNAGGSMSVSQDGLTVALGGFGRGRFSLFRMDPVTREVEALLLQKPFAGSERVVQISPDGTHVVISHQFDGRLVVYETESGQEVSTNRSEHADSITAVAFSPEGAGLITGSDDGVLKIWENYKDLESATTALQGHTQGITHAAFASHGRKVISSGSDQTVRIWDLDQDRDFMRRHVDRLDTYQAAISPDSLLFAAADRSSDRIRLWDMETGRLVKEFPREGPGQYYSVAFSPDGQLLAAGFGGLANVSYVELWDLNQEVLLATLPGTTDIQNFKTDQRTGLVSALAFSPDGKHLVAGFGSLFHLSQGDRGDHPLKLYDVATGRTVRLLAGHRNSCPTAVFSCDGSKLATASFDGTARIWDTNTWQTQQELRNPSQQTAVGAGRVMDVAFSPDGNRLAMASFEGEVAVWDTESGQLLRTLSGHTRTTAVAFSPDGRTLASGGMDQSLLLWNTATWRPVLRLDAGSGNFQETISLSFTPDGSQLLAGAEFACFWSAPPQHESFAVRTAARLAVTLNSKAEFPARIAMLSQDLRLHEALTLLAQKVPDNVPVAAALAAARANWLASRQEWKSAVTEFDRIREHSPDPASWLNAPGLLRLSLALLHQDRQGDAAKMVGAVGKPGRRFLNQITENSATGLVDEMMALVQQKQSVAANDHEFSELRAELAGVYSDYEQQITHYTATINALESLQPRPVADLQRLHARRGSAYVRLKRWQKALDDFVIGITDETTDEDILATQARAQAELILTGRWVDLEPTELKSKGGAKLTVKPDGSILASGDNPDRDVYTVVARPELTRITGIRLEALTDPSLPANGPGRHARSPGDGNFHLNEMRVLSGDNQVALTNAFATFQEANPQGDIASHAIDGKLDGSRGWTVNGAQGQSHTLQASLQLDRAVEDDLTIELHFSLSRWTQHNLGRFRLSVTDDANAIPASRELFAARLMKDPWQKLAAAHRIAQDQPAIDQLVAVRPQSAGLIGDLFIQGDNRDWQRAVDIYTAGIKQDTTDPELLSKRAVAYEELKNWEAAAGDWARAAMTDPEGAKLLIEFAQRLENVGKNSLVANARKNARQILEATLKARPYEASAIEQLGQLLIDLSVPAPGWLPLTPAHVKSANSASFVALENETFRFEHKPLSLTFSADAALNAVAIQNASGSQPGEGQAGPLREYRILSTSLPTIGFRGRFVRLDLPGENREYPRRAKDGPNKVLALSEVQVFRGSENLAREGRASQSTTLTLYGGGDAQRAIDGNTSMNWPSKSISHTEEGQDPHPWWEVDLAAETDFDRVVIWNRGEGFQSRLNWFRIQVLDEDLRVMFERFIAEAPDPSLEIGREVSLMKVPPTTSEDAPGWQLNLDVPAPAFETERRFRISLVDELSSRSPQDLLFSDDPKRIMLAASNLTPAPGTTLVVQTDGSFLIEGGVEETLDLPNLPAKVTALGIETINPDGPSFSEYRMQTLNAPVSESGFLMGRYVRIDLPGDSTKFPRNSGDNGRKMLSLAELQVFQGADNLALNQPARQSSTAAAGGPEKAVDGNTDGKDQANSFAHTDPGKDGVDPWWEVDLGAENVIDRIVVWNRLAWISRMNHFRIRILNADRQIIFEHVSNRAPNPSTEISCRSFVVRGSSANNDGWAVRPGRHSNRPFRIFSANTSDLLKQEEACALARKISSPIPRLAAAYDAIGDTVASTFWFNRALTAAQDESQRQEMFTHLQHYPRPLTELLKQRPEDLDLQFTLARSFVQRGNTDLDKGDAASAMASLQRARTIFEAPLKNHAEPNWIVLTPTRMQSAGDAVLSLAPDGSILAGGDNPVRDTYDLTFAPPSTDISALLLEAIPDPSMPGGGVGRSGSGSVALTGISLSTLSHVGVQRVDAQCVDAAADIGDALNAIDGHDATFWGVYPDYSEPHRLVLRMSEPLDASNLSEINVRLEFRSTQYSTHGLGRFRISVAGDPESFQSESARLKLKQSELADLDVAIGKAHALQSNTAEAAEAFGRALDLATDDVERVKIFAEAAVHSGVLETLAEMNADAAGLLDAMSHYFRVNGDSVRASSLAAQARALYEQRLEAEPTNSRLASKLADLLQFEIPGGWTELQRPELTSEKGTVLTRQPDGSILASGEPTHEESYTILADPVLSEFSVLRLELLSDPAFPNNGPGRSYVGIACLTEVSAWLEAANSEPVPLKFRFAWANFESVENPAVAAIDGHADTFLRANPGTEGRIAEFQLTTPARPIAGQRLKIALNFRNSKWPTGSLGRFRLTIGESAAWPTNPWLRLSAYYQSVGDSVRSQSTLSQAWQLALDDAARSVLVRDAAGTDSLMTALQQLAPNDKAIRLGPVQYLAPKLINSHRYQEAVDLLSTALSEFPDELELLNLRARACERLRQWDTAQMDYSRVIELESNDIRSRAAERARAAVQIRLGQFAEAADVHLREALQSPNDFAQVRDATVSLMLAGDLTLTKFAAERFYQYFWNSKNAAEALWLVRVFTAQPGLITSGNKKQLLDAAASAGGSWTAPLTAAIHYRLGDLKQSEPLLTSSHRMPQFQALAAMLLYDQGKIREARAMLRSGAGIWFQTERAKDPVGVIPDQQPWQEWGVRLTVWQQAAHKLAGPRLRELDAVLTRQPDQIPLLLERATLLEDVGLHDAAIKDLEHALQLDADPFPIHGLRGRVLAGLNRDEEAMAALNQAIDSNGDDSRLYATRGSIFLKQWKPEQARKDMERSVELNPSDPDAIALSELLVVAARQAVRRNAWEEAAAAYPRNVTDVSRLGILYEAAAALLLAGKTNEYRGVLKHMVDTAGEVTSPQVTFVLARTAILNKDSEFKLPTVQWGELAATDNPRGWTVHVAGLAQWRAGHLDLALERLDQSAASEWHPELNQVALSLLHARRGDVDKARDFLMLAREWLEQQEAAMADGNYRGQITDWLEFHILLREAESQFVDTK